jgi:predicted nucleic-acid-binding protein
MTADKFIDTNILVRLVVGDVAEQVKFVTELFKTSSQNKQTLYILPEVLTELKYVLTSSYKLRKETVVNVLEKIVSMDFIKVADTKNMDLNKVINCFKTENLSFEDCLFLQVCLQNKLELITFDRRLEKSFNREK